MEYVTICNWKISGKLKYGKYDRYELGKYQENWKCGKSEKYGIGNMKYVKDDNTHIAQNIAKRCQEYFLYFIAIKILSQYFCQILQNISS